VANQRTRDAAFAIFRPGKFMESKAQRDAAEKDLANAEQMRSAAMELARRQNWEPHYVSDLMPDYKKAESPVARAFLESLLTGTNPSSVQSTRLGAARLKAGAQQGFDQQFGGWDKLIARQRELEQETPWAPKQIEGPAVRPKGGEFVQSGVNRVADGGGWAGVGGQARYSAEQIRADPSGRTPAGAAALQDMWGTSEVEDQLAADLASGARAPSGMERIQQGIDAGNLDWLTGAKRGAPVPGRRGR